MHSQKRAYLYAFSAVLIWSTIATALTMTLRVMDKTGMLFWAFLVSFVVLAIITFFTGKFGAWKAYICKYWKRTLLLGTINPFIYYITLFYAYDLLPAQEAQAINYTWALMLAYLSVPLLGHRLSKWDVLAGLICYLGVVIIATHGNIFSLAFSNLTGVGIALLSTVFWALYWILITKHKEDTVVVLLSNFSVGVLWMGLYVLYADVSLTTYTSFALWGAVYIGLFEMGVTFVLWGRALILTERTSTISNLIFLSPILSLFFIHFVAGERIYFSTVIALVLILFGLFLQQRMNDKIQQ